MNDGVLTLYCARNIASLTEVSPQELDAASQPVCALLVGSRAKIKTSHLVLLSEQFSEATASYIAQSARHQNLHSCTSPPVDSISHATLTEHGICQEALTTELPQHPSVTSRRSSHR